jgi:uncharacterized OsmC-like protein
MSTRSVSAEWLGDYRVQVAAGTFQFRVDEPLTAGGSDTGPQPTDYFLASLASCFLMSIVYSARKHAVELSKPIAVTVIGTYDGPRYSHIAIEVDAELPDGAADRILTSAERVCYVTNTLRRPPEITVTLRPGSD